MIRWAVICEMRNWAPISRVLMPCAPLAHINAPGLAALDGPKGEMGRRAGTLVAILIVFARVLVPVLASIAFVGCNAYIERSKYDLLQQEAERVKKQLAEANETLRKMREETTPNRYQTFQLGFRRWRFDNASGTSCILLTTEADWKNPATKRQDCQC